MNHFWTNGIVVFMYTLVVHAASADGGCVMMLPHNHHQEAELTGGDTVCLGSSRLL